MKKYTLLLIYIGTKLTYLKNNNMKFYILLQFISSVEINNIIIIVVIKLELTRRVDLEFELVRV